MQVTDPFGWVGSTIDQRFVIESVAGEGGFGVVYRGLHLGFQLPVAVKCLRIPPGAGEQAQRDLLARFQEEARLLVRLSQRTANIVQALDVGAATSPNGQWTPYIVMEWLEGQTLARDLERRRSAGEAPLGLGEAIQLLGPAASALAIAHQENVSHRDVKPANLFLARAGGGTTLKILDFGVAKVLSEATMMSGLRTQSHSPHAPFTPLYGAPEQFSGRFGATGSWTDVFALALIFIEVVTGQQALAGDDVIQLLTSAIAESSRPSLGARGVSASREVEDVITRALAASARLRFRNAGEMWAALDAAHAHPGARADLGATQSTGDPASVRSPFAPTVEVMTGENRVCTVMFVDLAEATDLSAHLDPESVKEIVDRCSSIVNEQVEAMGGVVEELPGGDRVMALFGVPRSTDNDAERAVLAALGVQASIARLALPRALRASGLSVRIGIGTGRVFAEHVTGGARPRVKVIGEAANAAARLQQAAPPGAIVIGRDTYRQVVGLFHAEPLAPVESAGRKEALPAFRVTGMSTYRPAMALSDFHGVETKLVGRAAEMQRLTDALETMLSERRAGLVTLLGPPGVGRSRMLGSLFSSLLLRREDLVVLVAQCSPLLMSTSYGLVASLIRRRFDIADTDAPPVVRRKLRTGMRWLRMRHRESWAREDALDSLDAADLDDALDQIAAVLGARSVSHPTSLEDAGNPARQRILAAAARLLRFAASVAPMVILCDDIQWADGASLELLDDLLLRLEGSPVLAVCAARSEMLERLPSWGEGKATHTRIDLAPLSRRHMEEMIRDWLRKVPDLSPSVVRTLADRAEGHPLILVETLHLLVDAGVIEARGEGPWSIREEALGALALPATVQGIAQARLDRLEAEPRGVLARAAVVGRTFWEGAVERLQSDRPPAELLARLRHRQLIRPREPATFPGEREYVFAESALYEVTYETLSVKVRRPLHLAVARWLEERASGAAGDALLALHYERGGDLGRAAAAYVRAAARASSLGANTEALRHLERAGELYAEQEDGGEDAEARATPWRDAVRLRIDLGDVLRRLGRLDEAEQSCEGARSRIHRPDPASPVERADALRFDARIDHRLALVHRVRGATKEAIALVERAIAQAREAGAVDETPAMYALLAVLCRRERRLPASLAAAREGLRVCRASGERDERWRENVAQLLCGIGNVLVARGRTMGAERSYRQALRAVDEAKQPWFAGIALNGIAGCRLMRGELRGVRDLYARSLRLKERAGDLHQIAIACNNLGEVELRLGHAPAALDLARRSVRMGEEVSAGSDLADFYRNLSEASLAAGQVEEALAAGTRALAIAENTGRVYLGDVAVSLARVCARAVEGTPGDALRTQALDAARLVQLSLSAHFKENELRRRAEECRVILAQAFTGMGEKD